MSESFLSKVAFASDFGKKTFRRGIRSYALAQVFFGYRWLFCSIDNIQRIQLQRLWCNCVVGGADVSRRLPVTYGWTCVDRCVQGHLMLYHIYKNTNEGLLALPIPGSEKYISKAPVW